MTDNEIIKALECCHSKGDCDGCPLNMQRFEREVDCVEIITQSALDLINRQKEDIERITLEYAGFQAGVNCFADIGKMYSEIRTEAIKEFAERLKKSSFPCDVSFGFGGEHCEEAVTVLEIDNLVKEMTEATP